MCLVHCAPALQPPVMLDGWDEDTLVEREDDKKVYTLTSDLYMIGQVCAAGSVGCIRCIVKV